MKTNSTVLTSDAHRRLRFPDAVQRLFSAAPQSRDPQTFCDLVRWTPDQQRTAPQERRAALRPGNANCYGQKEGPPKRAFEFIRKVSRSRSGGLGVDLGEVVLGGLRTVGDELAEIFGGGLRPRHEHFTARTNQIGLDLNRFVQRLGGCQLVDAGEERLGVLIDRLLDVAADLGGFANRTGNGGLDRSSRLLRTGVKVGGANLGGLGLLLHEVTGRFGHFHVLEILERVGDRRESFLDAVQYGIGFGGHWVSPSSGLSYGLTPSGLARGEIVVSHSMVRRNINVAMRYHEFVICSAIMRSAG